MHVRDMEEDGLVAFVRSVYWSNFRKGSLILDIRYNCGGPGPDLSAGPGLAV